MMARSALLAGLVVALLASPASRAEYKFRTIPFSVPPQTEPLTWLRFYADGEEVFAIPATWYGCQKGCAVGVVRLWLDDGQDLTMRTERRGVLGPPSRSMPTEIFETLGEHVRRNAIDVNGDCRVDSIDDAIRARVNEGEIE